MTAAVLLSFFATPVFAANVSRRIDGLPVPKSRANPWLFAVMIDGHVNARPQAGLKKASVVYEALAEGGIPRFMAIFANRDVGLIGPVRSVRPYFVRWAAEYRAALAHAGGSPDGLILLKSLRMPNFEGVKGKTAQFFFRYGGTGVHNLFTNSARLISALKHARYNKYKPTYRPWEFSLDLPLAKRRPGLHGAEIDLAAGQTYDVRYQYDRRRNIYRRFTGGRPHVDRTTGKQLYAKNVVLLLVPKERVLDRKGRIDLQILGRGKAILLKDGRSVTINWRKATTYGRTIFTNSQGKEISLNRGPTWITVVPRGHRYTLF